MEETEKKEAGQSLKAGKAGKAGKPVGLCVLFTIIAAAGIIAGLILKNPLWTILGLVPTAVYEVIRTAGVSTKVSSIILAVVLAAELALIIFHVNFNLAKFLGMTHTTISGYSIVLGDIRVVGAALMAILSVVLIIRTAGPYTKWLAVNIIVACFAVIYTIAPKDFNELIRLAIQQVMQRINFH